MPEQIPLFDSLPIYLGPVTKHPAYSVWRHMLRRCHNPNAADFDRYGGRGISVCQEWRGSSRAFVAWAIKAGYQLGLQLDRKNNNRGYSPRNCHFVTCRENNNNRRDTRRLSDGTPFGYAVALSGLSKSTVYNRLCRNWPPDDAVSIPAGGKRPLPDAFQSVGDAAASVVAATVAARRKPKAKRKGRAPVIPSGLADLPSADLESPSYDPGYPAAWLAKRNDDA